MDADSAKLAFTQAQRFIIGQTATKTSGMERRVGQSADFLDMTKLRKGVGEGVGEGAGEGIGEEAGDREGVIDV